MENLFSEKAPVHPCQTHGGLEGDSVMPLTDNKNEGFLLFYLLILTGLFYNNGDMQTIVVVCCH